MIDEIEDLSPEARAVARRRFRRTLASVMAVQVVTLLFLWWLQAHFSP